MLKRMVFISAFPVLLSGCASFRTEVTWDVEQGIARIAGPGAFRYRNEQGAEISIERPPVWKTPEMPDFVPFVIDGD